MIELNEKDYYSIEQADEIIERAFAVGKVKSYNKQVFYKMICAFDIETTSFQSEDNIIDEYLYNYIYKRRVYITDISDDLKAKLKPFLLIDKNGISLDEFYVELRDMWPEWFSETIKPYEQIENILNALIENEPQKEKDKHSIVYCWQFAINGTVIFGRHMMEFVKLLNMIEKRMDPKEKVLIFVHNLAFEFQFLRKYLKWKKVFSIAPRKPLFARTECGIEFRCSYLLTNYSLAKLAEQLKIYNIKKLIGDLDYTKIRTPETPMTREEIQYCMNDVLILNAYIQECIIKEKHIFNIPYTATGYCRRYTRNKCLYLMPGYKHNTQYANKINSLTLEVNEYKMLKRCFAGGFTHCSYRYSGKILENVNSIDFTSSYPYCLLSEQYPMSKGKQVKPTKEQFKKYIKYYCCMFDLEIEGLETRPGINEHYISMSKCWQLQKYVIDNGRIERAAHLFITVTELDYKLIHRLYKVKKEHIYNMYIYKKDYLPRELIQAIIKLYKDKTELKGVPCKEDEYINGKALLNAVFGMMVTDISKDEILYENDEWSNKDKNIEKDIERYNKSKKRFLFYPWGVWCTAFARYNLFTGIMAFGDDYIYSDTDSLKVLNIEMHVDYIEKYNANCKKKLSIMCRHRDLDYSDLEPMTIKGIKKPLGVWDYETKNDPYIYFKSLGAKRYLTYQMQDGYHLTVAGVNKKKALPYLLDEYGTAVFEAFDNALIIPEEHTGKLTHCYIDYYDSGTVIDDCGNEYKYNTPSGIYLEKAPYCFDIAEDYIQFLKGVFITK